MSGIEEIINTIIDLASTGGGTAILVIGGVMVTVAVSVGKKVLFFVFRDCGDIFTGELPSGLFK